MSKLKLTTLFVVVFVCLTFERASAACKDLPSCVLRASTQCHLPAVRNNCKNMCGACTTSPKRTLSRNVRRGTQNMRPRQNLRPSSPIRTRTVPQRASPAAQARARKIAEARRRQMNQRRRNNPRQTQRQTCTDHPNCVHWSRNGFCTSIYRTEAEKRSYCPNACKLCNKDTINNNPSKQTTRKPVVKPTHSVPAVTVAPSTEIPYALFQHSLNESVDPCTDFYQFACGRYQSENPATGGESFSRLIEHQHKVEKQLMSAVFENEASSSSAIAKMRKFRDSCLDTKTIEAEKTTALRAEMDKIGGGMPMLTSDPPKWDATKFKLTQALIDINKLTSRNYFFDMDPYTDPKNGATSLCFKPMELLIKNPDDYTNAASKQKVDALKTFLAEIVDYLAQDMASEKKTMTGIDFSTIQTAVDDLIALETALAAEFKAAKMDDPATLQASLSTAKKYTDFKTILDAPADPNMKIDINSYFGTGANIFTDDPDIQNYLKTSPDVYIHTDTYFQKYIDIMTDPAKTKPETLANYLHIRYLIHLVPYLDSRFAASADRFALALDGINHVSTRQQNCFDMARGNFPVALDHQYNELYLDARSQLSGSKIMEKLREGFGNVMRATDWMEKPDKNYGIAKKLSATKEEIGEIDEARDVSKLDALYSKLTFSAGDKYRDMYKNVLKAHGYIKYRRLVQANSFAYNPSMSASGLSAYFINEQNRLFVPAAILQQPFLDLKLPASVSYGAVGFLYGFGLSHGFDEQGGEFDQNGSKRKWWSAETLRDFRNKGQCMPTLYSALTEPVTGKKVDGGKTLSENIADSGAIRAAYEAYKAYLTANPTMPHVPGYKKYNTDQTFFLGYATMMCASLDKTYQDNLLNTDNHAPNEFRVNTVLANFPHFAEAFKCAAGTKMNPVNKCSVW